MRRAIGILSTALITAGLVILADVAVTLAWKEPVSSIYGAIQQGEAEDELEDLEARFPTAGDLEAIAEVRGVGAKVEVLADRFATRIHSRPERSEGAGIGRIRIPSIGADYVLVEGTETASLQKGPGHYPKTGFPGQGRTIGVAAHRTTYLAPFRKIDGIEDGDQVVLEMPYGSLIYEVEKHRIVDPGAVEIVRDVGYERLVLTACHPLYSAAERYAVFARLRDVSLFVAGDRRWEDP